MLQHSSILSDRFKEAFEYAFRLHQSQIRKGSNVPYISHLMAVTALVLENEGNEEEAIAALLHDAVEDQGGMETLEQIKIHFGDRIAEIVEECSDAFSSPKPPWRDRKLKYLGTLAKANPSVLKVSLADKLHNLRSLVPAYRKDGEEIWKHFRGGKVGTLWYHHQLSETFHQHGENAMLLEYDRVLNQLDVLVEIKSRD